MFQTRAIKPVHKKEKSLEVHSSDSRCGTIQKRLENSEILTPHRSIQTTPLAQAWWDDEMQSQRPFPDGQTAEPDTATTRSSTSEPNLMGLENHYRVRVRGHWKLPQSG